MKRRSVEILFFEGCPHAQLAVERARVAIHATGDQADLHLVKIEHALDAVTRRFLGSPTVRVDGVDVDHGGLDRTDFALQCRMYSVDGHLDGSPPVDWIEAALRQEV